MGTGYVPPDDLLENELAALRIRAYGVGADIDDDPWALARLAELESWHASNPRSGSSAEPATVARESDAPASARTFSSIASVTSRVGADTRHDRPQAAPRGRVTRGRVGAFALGAATMAALVLLGGGFVAWNSPRPDAVLPAVDVEPDFLVHHLIDYARELLIDETTLRAYESYRGIELWGADSALGNRCLLALEPSSESLLAAGCVPSGAEPAVEIYSVPINSRNDWHEGLPLGTVVRFELSDDEVLAWLYEGTPPD